MAKTFSEIGWSDVVKACDDERAGFSLTLSDGTTENGLIPLSDDPSLSGIVAAMKADKAPTPFAAKHKSAESAKLKLKLVRPSHVLEATIALAASIGPAVVGRKPNPKGKGKAKAKAAPVNRVASAMNAVNGNGSH